MSKSFDAGQDRYRERQRREKDFQKQLPGEDDDPLPPPVEPIHTNERPRRNDPCSCGSGKKYKLCCGLKEK
jgi:uncharacterized protein YecA (UPF0149 family)